LRLVEGKNKSSEKKKGIIKKAEVFLYIKREGSPSVRLRGGHWRRGKAGNILKVELQRFPERGDCKDHMSSGKKKRGHFYTLPSGERNASDAIGERNR